MRTFIIITIVLCTGVAQGVVPHASIAYLPSANGLCYISFNLNKGFVDTFFPHINDVWDVDQETRNLLSAIRIRLMVDGKEIYFSQLANVRADYINGTGIIRVEKQLAGQSLFAYIWAPMILDFKVLMMVLQIPTAQGIDIKTSDIVFELEPPGTPLDAVRKDMQEEGAICIAQAFIDGSSHSPGTISKVLNEIAKANPNRLVEAEERWWMHWHRLGSIPARIILQKHEVLLQSIAFIKMAQCRESGSSYGQIVASLSPYNTDAAYTRDMAYSVVALSRIRHLSEARAAIEFMLKAEAGMFVSHHINRTEWGMGRSYLVSLSHYAGLGLERAEYIDQAPALFFDSHPLFLWALHEYHKHCSDLDFLQSIWPRVTNYIIEPIIASVEENGLIRRDSGLWKVAAPGEHFSFTSMSAYQGLTSAAILAKVLAEDELAETCNQVAAVIRESILTNLTTGRTRVMTRSLEKKTFPGFLDGSTVEAINWQILNPNWKSAISTIRALEAFLRVGKPPRGFAMGYRDPEKTWPENLFVTLRAVEAYNRLGERKKASEILDWIIAQASRNNAIIPEFFTEHEANYDGRYPLIGMGAGTYILATLQD